MREIKWCGKWVANEQAGSRKYDSFCDERGPGGGDQLRDAKTLVVKMKTVAEVRKDRLHVTRTAGHGHSTETRPEYEQEKQKSTGGTSWGEAVGTKKSVMRINAEDTI